MFSETKSGRADEAHVVDEVERDPTDDVADHDVRQRHEALALSVRPRLGVRRRAGLRTALR